MYWDQKTRGKIWRQLPLIASTIHLRATKETKSHVKNRIVSFPFRGSVNIHYDSPPLRYIIVNLWLSKEARMQSNSTWNDAYRISSPKINTQLFLDIFRFNFFHIKPAICMTWVYVERLNGTLMQISKAEHPLISFALLRSTEPAAKLNGSLRRKMKVHMLSCTHGITLDVAIARAMW